MNQYPSLNQSERDCRNSELKKKLPTPVSYQISLDANSTNFPTAASGSPVVAYYARFSYTPTENMGLAFIQHSLLLTPVAATPTAKIMAIYISYLPAISIPNVPVPTAPSDVGNWLYSYWGAGAILNNDVFYQPNMYFLEANKPLYIFLLVDATTITAGTSGVLGSIRLGLLATGFQ